MDSSTRIVFVCIVIGILLILIGFIFGIIDFHKDYQCSTTTDPKWFIEHDCMRYVKWYLLYL